MISWTRAKRRSEELTEEDRAVSTTTLLEDFLALASADPEQMGAFMARYGVLEICGEHGQPDGHRDDIAFCPFLIVDERLGVSVAHIRRAARAFADLLHWGQAARKGWKRPAGVGLDTQRLMPGFLVGDNVTDRDRIAAYLTALLRETGVRPLVTWNPRLSLTHVAGGLLGTLAMLLAREIAARSGWTYNCDVCGVLVERVRPPQPDEAVYCTKESCKREQRRRNQATWRARKRAEGTN